LATSLATSQPWPLAGCTYDDDGGNDLRNGTVTPFFYDPGPSGSGSTISPLGGVIGGAGLLVTAAGGVTVAVEQGHFVVPNTSSPTSGAYAATLAQSGTVTLNSADPSNPRIDIVVAVVNDLGTSSSDGQVTFVAGTPSASPSAPAAPANSITLAQVAVPAAATSVTSGNITDTRPFTCAAGGVLVAAKGSVLGYYGQLAYDFASDSFYNNKNAGSTPAPRQARMLPFAPVTAVLTGGAYSLATSAAQVPGLSATVTCDGQTDLKVTYHIAGFTGLSSAVTYVTVGVYLDGTLIDETVVTLNATLSAQGGVTGIGYTGAATANTPSAASHTVTVQAWSSAASGGSPAVHAFAGLPASAWMRVEPVGL
jgi:hypothetical protein